MLTREELLMSLKEVNSLPSTRCGARGRTIYEAGKGPHLIPSGHFYVDYASFPGGTNKEVRRSLIDSFESDGLIIRAFSSARHINAWRLNEWHPDQQGEEKLRG